MKGKYKWSLSYSLEQEMNKILAGGIKAKGSVEGEFTSLYL